VVQPLEVDDLDVVSAPRYVEQVLVEGRADQQQPGSVGPWAKPVPSFDETIEMATADAFASLGFAEGGDTTGCWVGVVVGNDEIELPLVALGHQA